MIYYITGGSIAFLLILIGGILSFYTIRSKYREYDRKMTLKENIDTYRRYIDGAMEYFRNKYFRNEETKPVFENINIKAKFILNLINHEDSDETKLSYLDRLYKMLYETEQRLIRNWDDVSNIISPLNNLRDEMVEKKIESLKKIQDEESLSKKGL